MPRINLMPSKKPTTKKTSKTVKKTSHHHDVHHIQPEVYYLAILFIAISGFLVMSM